MTTIILINYTIYLGGFRNVLASNGRHAFYPLGSTLVARSLGAGGGPNGCGQHLLTGHAHPICCLHLSNSGHLLVTGEEHQVGTKVRYVKLGNCII